MKVSIIIPVYDVEEYILDCLNSVSDQDYRNIECLIIDDCGKDSSVKIAESFICNYEGPINFKILKRDTNGGLSEARNTGIINSTGDYLYFLDSDDEITSDAISYLVEKIKIGNYDMACAEFVHTWNDLKNNTEAIEEEFQDERTILAINKKNNAWNKLIRKSIIIENNLFFEPNIYHEDRLWSFLVNLQLKSVFWSNKATYIYRIRPNSIITDINKLEKRIDDSVYIIKKMENYFYSQVFPTNQFNMIINYIERERYATSITAFLLSTEKAKIVYLDLMHQYTITRYLSLSFKLKIKALCWILNPKIGFNYMSLFNILRYSNKP